MDKTQTTSTSERAAFAERVKDGQNGETSGMRISINTAKVSSKEKRGGKESMGSGGTVHGGKVTMALVGCTSTGKAAVHGKHWDTHVQHDMRSPDCPTPPTSQITFFSILINGLRRWGEKYDGHGSNIKYTDKWAERLEGDRWTKWGDKWDENFNQYGQGVKQGETWWEGKYGEWWNCTWGEGHNGSGWVHKYGKSSCTWRALGHSCSAGHMV
ncbi:hypothetical protein IFM89_032581 [Coptis chinensis]|uniref:Uncharacterized protein n=1 Tax=Coptis chinensis TaxID=261450 RepID=A0A835M7Z7_9MAGN|nr:hypothetical protein IFM89_032581 [Coptis chinensis]